MHAPTMSTIASIAPTLGPVVGGWLTDTLNWHWLFYVNLVPGAAFGAAGKDFVRFSFASSVANLR